MLGIGFVKAQPTTHLIEYRNGRIAREGPGLSFFYFSPATSLVAVPVGSRDVPFIFEVATADFQAATVQGQVTYRIARPRAAAAMLNFTLRPDGRTYESDDPKKLPERVTAIAQVVIQGEVGALPLRDALRSSDAVTASVATRFAAHPEVVALGIELLGLSILAIKPTVETARALEAEAREAMLRAADVAIFERRNASVDGERRIRENELNTEVAVEQKKRLIRETQMAAEASLREKKHALDRADMTASIGLEEDRKAFVERKAQNIRTLAEADAHRMRAVVDALAAADPRIVQALAASGMEPGQLIAQAFGGIAERAEKIGELNVSPDLLAGLLAAKRKESERGSR
jgi:hypothetical protein